MATQGSSHYQKEYFDWQGPIGEFGGWANRPKFHGEIQPGDTVLDFGCGGGSLLQGLTCGKRLGVEVNPVAVEEAMERGVEVFFSAEEIPGDSVDVVISNHALEHTQHPLDELYALYYTLKPGGKIVVVVPCETISCCYKPQDMSHHLYSWSPMCLGNLLTEAGFVLQESKPYYRKWPPGYRQIARWGGRRGFELACWMYAHLDRTMFQTRAVAIKPE